MITKRILQIIDYKHINKNKFYKDTGLSNGFLDKVKDIGVSKIEYILKAYPDINPEWLLTGNGNMIKDDESFSDKEEILKIQQVPFYDFEKIKSLKQLFDLDKNHNIVNNIKIPNLPKCDGAILLTGDSMYPLLKTGDIILYRETGIKNIFYGEMYLLSIQIEDWDEYITVRYLMKSEKGESYIRLESQNQQLESLDIKIHQIKAIAMIKASVRFNTMI